MFGVGGKSGKCGSPNCERNNDDGQVGDSGKAHNDGYASVRVCLKRRFFLKMKTRKDFLIKEWGEYEQSGRLLYEL